LLSCGKGACGFSRAVKFRPSVLQKIFLFPYGRAYLFAKNLTALNPASLIADETKVTDLTDYAYKKSQHDEKR
jgi:hypothetical protein